MVLVYQSTLPLIIWIMCIFRGSPEPIEQPVDGYFFWRFSGKSLPWSRVGPMAILSFAFAWNNFIFGLVLGAKETFPVTDFGFISYESVLWGQMAAASIVTILPEVIIAFFIQKYLVRGLSMGAVRG
jgi:multiple sugar transport system permease protein